MLLMYLSGAMNKAKPELIAMQDFALYDRIKCTQDCADNKTVGLVKRGEALKVLSQLKGKTKIVLRVETSNAAGWIAYDESLMQKAIQDSEENNH